ncbi:MAG TPA: HxsD-like protein [Candidatus Omnitrophota bacterium]|jgi:hypothetical protein|nr:HxsD-like protein [Candidatus Omnitrophota bacterium]HSA31250.1 HxsD-like protein [Candidatus Omnitrophota bacterium]
MLTIPFHKNLYSQAHIEAAFEQFKDFGKFEIRSKGQYFHVSVDDDGQLDDAEIFISEFKNYVLYLEIAHAQP